ncbi:hypothetical protein ACFWSF_29630 [Streptomyces sp. NPDC058611]|uniref:hypothetical protein n=1 Tax=unclassified Streptomyces TaxID=2593676 RepID=UPI0036536C33
MAGHPGLLAQGEGAADLDPGRPRARAAATASGLAWPPASQKGSPSAAILARSGWSRGP